MGSERIGRGEPRAHARGRQKSIFLMAASGLIVLAHGVDVVQARGPNWPALAVRLVWAALLLATAALIVRGDRTVSKVSSWLAGAGTTLLYLALLGVTGRSRSPLFSFTFVLAMLLPIVMGDLIRVALTSSALLVGGAGAMLFLDGATAGDLLGWGHVGVVALAVTWLLGAANLRARRAAEALDRTREAELRRLAEGERLAAVGRMAARVAHEVNSPLSAARATATFIREEVSSPDAEVEAACADLVGALDRIAGLVRTLGPADRASTRGDVEP